MIGGDTMDDLDNARTPGTEEPTAAAPSQTPAEEIPQLIDLLRVAMLRRMTLMLAALPAGYYTETKGVIDATAGTSTWKMRDFAASLKDLAAIGGKPTASGPGSPDVESWEPLRGLLGEDPHSFWGGGEDDEDPED